jgi:hypothetical protein
MEIPASFVVNKNWLLLVVKLWVNKQPQQKTNQGFPMPRMRVFRYRNHIYTIDA